MARKLNGEKEEGRRKMQCFSRGRSFGAENFASGVVAVTKFKVVGSKLESSASLGILDV